MVGYPEIERAAREAIAERSASAGKWKSTLGRMKRIDLVSGLALLIGVCAARKRLRLSPAIFPRILRWTRARARIVIQVINERLRLPETLTARGQGPAQMAFQLYSHL
jgi:hypothetical protein